MSLESDIKAFQEKSLKQASTKVSKVASDYFKKVVEFSPDSNKGTYSVGTIKDNWYSSVASPDTSFGGTHDDVGASSLMRIYSTLESQPFLNRDNKVFLSNSTKWAYRAEYIGWPNGLDPETNWTWVNGIQPYAMVRNATNYIQGKV
jgi:hypothetical protein